MEETEAENISKSTQVQGKPKQNAYKKKTSDPNAIMLAQYESEIAKYQKQIDTITLTFNQEIAKKRDISSKLKTTNHQLSSCIVELKDRTTSLTTHKSDKIVDPQSQVVKVKEAELTNLLKEISCIKQENEELKKIISYSDDADKIHAFQSKVMSLNYQNKRMQQDIKSGDPIGEEADYNKEMKEEYVIYNKKLKEIKRKKFDEKNDILKVIQSEVAKCDDIRKELFSLQNTMKRLRPSKTPKMDRYDRVGAVRMNRSLQEKEIKKEMYKDDLYLEAGVKSSLGKLLSERDIDTFEEKYQAIKGLKRKEEKKFEVEMKLIKKKKEEIEASLSLSGGKLEHLKNENSVLATENLKTRGENKEINNLIENIKTGINSINRIIEEKVQQSSQLTAEVQKLRQMTKSRTNKTQV